MRIASLAATAALPTALALLITASAVAQTTEPATSQPAPATTEGSGTLIKLGTGLTRGFAIGGYNGLSLPVVLSAEHHLTPTLSVYGNTFASLEMGRRYQFFDSRHQSRLGDYGFDLGVKYYYNQEKRRQQGRTTGPFQGNYLALHSNSTFNPDSYRLSYQYSTLTVVWGMQRRIGKYGWFDAYIGGGIGREPGYTYNGYYGPTKYAARFGFAPELGIKFSLGKVAR
ncbi:hypothetical protein [Hymenobacter rigui]|uniref:DUF3575 domain-containing protein n=1 Tax=Hymenobacter rigui TaxID=334424 RepID=A0A3R9MVK5_9BACT|nr:hypothetical protein [Hymenobacter rigui]RSK49503.1 hypothetical protein EI291_08405 [Hymenobacter rigui]